MDTLNIICELLLLSVMVIYWIGFAYDGWFKPLRRGENLWKYVSSSNYAYISMTIMFSLYGAAANAWVFSLLGFLGIVSVILMLVGNVLYRKFKK